MKRTLLLAALLASCFSQAVAATYTPNANDVMTIQDHGLGNHRVNAQSYISTQAAASASDLAANNTFTGVNTFAGVVLGTTLKIGAGVLVDSATAPSVASGFGTSPSVPHANGTYAFTINVGTSNTGTGVLTLPAAANGWECKATDTTTVSTTVFRTDVVPTSATTVTFQNYSDVGATHAWVDSDILSVQCAAY